MDQALLEKISAELSEVTDIYACDKKILWNGKDLIIQNYKKEEIFNSSTSRLVVSTSQVVDNKDYEITLVSISAKEADRSVTFILNTPKNIENGKCFISDLNHH